MVEREKEKGEEVKVEKDVLRKERRKVGGGNWRESTRQIANSPLFTLKTHLQNNRQIQIERERVEVYEYGNTDTLIVILS